MYVIDTPTKILINTTQVKTVMSYLFIEDSNDREEVIEKDWISKCVIDFNNIRVKITEANKANRGIIEKHAPKITEKEFCSCIRSDFWESWYEAIEELLKEKWIYKE